jgi:hypothetical protein
VVLALTPAWQPDPAALVPLYRQAVAEREKQYGPDHPKIARIASDLGLLLRNQGDRADFGAQRLGGSLHLADADLHSRQLVQQGATLLEAG